MISVLLVIRKQQYGVVATQYGHLSPATIKAIRDDSSVLWDLQLTHNRLTKDMKICEVRADAWGSDKDGLTTIEVFVE